MSLRVSALSARFIPLLSFLLLNTPLGYVGALFHEEGHCILALAEGGTCTGVVIGQSGDFALANSYLVSIGGWIGQYFLVAVVVLIAWKFEPKGFLAKSVVTIFVVDNLLNPPAYIASLQGDSAGVLTILEGTGINQLVSVAIVESAAIVLFLVGGFVAWRYLRKYFAEVFGWVGAKRSSAAAALFIAGGAASILLVYTPFGEAALTNNVAGQILVALAFLVIFSFIVIPAPPPAWKATDNAGPSLTTVVFVVILFLEAQLFYYFVLPIWLPFP